MHPRREAGAKMSKVTARHRERRAYVYVRQSSLAWIPTGAPRPNALECDQVALGPWA